MSHRLQLLKMMCTGEMGLIKVYGIHCHLRRLAKTSSVDDDARKRI